MIGAAVLGATGAVGQRFLERLHGHPDFEVRALAASERRVGHAYGESTWLLDAAMPGGLADEVLVGVPEVAQRDDVQVVFSALPGGLAGSVETQLAQQGLRVFTNAGDHRMDPHVPLLVPEVNPDHLALVDRQGPGWIVANGNCSAIVLSLALAPLHRAFGLEEVHVTTLQGLSGAGYPGVSSLDIVDNVLPHIQGEEDKLATEPQKTLGTLTAKGVRHAPFRVHATATRVPVREGHLESVHVRLNDRASLEHVAQAFQDFRGPPEAAALPSAPERPIHVTTDPDRPQPRRDRDTENGMAITVGRLRLDEDHKGLRFVVLGHNTLRGAAGQSVLNAEYAKVMGRIG